MKPFQHPAHPPRMHARTHTRTNTTHTHTSHPHTRTQALVGPSARGLSASPGGAFLLEGWVLMFVFGVLVVWGLALEFRVSVSLTFVQNSHFGITRNIVCLGNTDVPLQMTVVSGYSLGNAKLLC